MNVGAPQSPTEDAAAYAPAAADASPSALASSTAVLTRQTVESASADVPVVAPLPPASPASPVGADARDAGEVRARPVNPYLNNTPELRARRLARALVSDLVAYNPQKREEGLRDGTLRQLFRDEIRKSWDEYVEQVGASVAESTPHFQDALNDVLAGGRRVF